MNKGRYPTIDQFVGTRIRERRCLLGLSQRQLADSIGMATQQMIFKYERGQSAVTASLLYEIAGALHTSPDYFFEGFGRKAKAFMPPHQPKLFNLMRSLGEIESEAYRQVIGHIIRTLAG